MRNIKQLSKLFFLAILFSIALPLITNAQPTPDADDVDAPLDGGISLLVAAGAIVGARKIRNNRVKK